MTDMLLNNVRLPDGAAVDVLISGDRIAGIGPNLQAPPEDRKSTRLNSSH